MTTIAKLAQELKVQSYELAAYADLGSDYLETDELDPELEAMIRETWTD